MTEPDIASEEELRAFNAELRSILYYFDIDIDKEMKADLNISLSNARVEVKNITGIKNLIDAARYEIERQGALLSRGEEPKAETRSYVQKSMKTERSREKETDEEYGYIFEPDLTFYSTDIELRKPVFASKIAKEYAAKYNASEKTINELIAYDKEALELLEATAGKYSMQSIIASLELLKKYKVHMAAENFVKLIALVESHSSIDEKMVVAISEGREVEQRSQVNEADIEKAIERMLDSDPGIIVELKKNPKSINMIIGRVSKETGAQPSNVAKVARRIIDERSKN